MNNRLTDYPVVNTPVNRITEAVYLANRREWNASLLKVNSDANKALGRFLGLFVPDCNAHRSLLEWFEEDVNTALPITQRKRTDFKIRNMQTKFYAEYRPNKEINLSAKQKEWEALTDEGRSFADFGGEYHRLIKEMERIYKKPRKARQYEILRENVRNPHLQNIKEALSYEGTNRISIEDFFTRCNTFIQLNPSLDSVTHKRKADEEAEDLVVAKAARLRNESSKPKSDARCFRCGNPGHWRVDWDSGKFCRVQHCSTCNAHIGNGTHNATNCSEKGRQLFKDVKREKPSETKKKKSKNGKNGKKSSSSGGGGTQSAPASA